MMSDLPLLPPPYYFNRPEVDLAHVPENRRLALSSSLASAIVSQVDYYFSDENLVRDEFLRSKMDNQGWVNIFKIAEFKRIMRMTNDIEFLLCSIRSSSTNVEVQGIKLRKRIGWERWIIPQEEDD